MAVRQNAVACILRGGHYVHVLLAASTLARARMHHDKHARTSAALMAVQLHPPSSPMRGCMLVSQEATPPTHSHSDSAVRSFKHRKKKKNTFLTCAYSRSCARARITDKHTHSNTALVEHVVARQESTACPRASKYIHICARSGRAMPSKPAALAVQVMTLSCTCCTGGTRSLNLR